MVTIQSPEIIQKLLENNGHFESGIQVYAIYSYTHSSSEKEHFAIFHRERDIDIGYSPYTKNAENLFYNGRISLIGEKWLKERRRNEK